MNVIKPTKPRARLPAPVACRRARRADPGHVQAGVQMSESDPHIHVQSNLNADAAVRTNATPFGPASDPPRRAANTLTDNACTTQLQRRSLMPGMNVSSSRARPAADRHRDLAEKCSGMGNRVPESIPSTRNHLQVPFCAKRAQFNPW